MQRLDEDPRAQTGAVIQNTVSMREVIGIEHDAVLARDCRDEKTIWRIAPSILAANYELVRAAPTVPDFPPDQPHPVGGNL